MAKKIGPNRDGGKNLQAPDGGKTKRNSGPIGDGSLGGGVWVNERGETCIGTECWQMAVDTERNEIRVNIKQNAGGGCELNPLIDALRESLSKGSRTIYEVEVSPDDA